MALLSVDLTSGVRTIISDSATPNSINALTFPRSLVLDNANNQVLVMDDILDTVMVIQVDSGERVILSKSKRVVIQ